MTRGERLRKAIQDAGLNVTEFAERMKGVPGASRPNIHRYLADGDPQPSVTFIEEAAKRLGVSPSYLAGFQSEMTEEAQQAREEVSASASSAVDAAKATLRDRETKQAIELKLAILHAMGILPDKPELKRMLEGDLDASPDHMVQALDAWMQRVNLAHIPAWVPALTAVRGRYEEPRIDAEGLGAALLGPLEAVGVDPAAGMDSTYRTEDWLDDYITAMVPVLLALAPERKRQRKEAKEKEDTDVEA